MPKRVSIAAVVGVLGGVATMVGPALPWLSYAGQTDPNFGPVAASTLNGFVLDPFGTFFAVGLTVAAAWLWAGSDARKAVAFMGPIAVAIGTVCVSIIITKESAFLGDFSSGQEAAVEVGVYVTLGGAVAALAAALIAVWPARTRSEESVILEPEDDALPQPPG